MSFNTFQSIKEKTKNVVREASNKGSCFESWSSDSLKNLLIEHNVQVRGSKQATRRTLVRICDELIEGEFREDENDFMRVYTMEQMLQMDKAARMIQSGYFEYRQKQRQPRTWSNLVIDVVGSKGDEPEHYTVQDCDGEPSYYDESRVHDVEQALMNGEQYNGHQSAYDEEDFVCDEENSFDESYESRGDEQDEFGSTRRGLIDEEEGVDEKEGASREQTQSDTMTGSYDEEIGCDDMNTQTNEEPNTTIISHEKKPEFASQKESSHGDCFPPEHIDEVVTTSRRKNSNKYSRKLDKPDPSRRITGSNKHSRELDKPDPSRRITGPNKHSRELDKREPSRRITGPNKHSRELDKREASRRITGPNKHGRELDKREPSRKITGHLDQELNAQWVKPSWRLAKEFEAENRPHRSGKEMKPYHWRKVTLGRHCTIGGCGEQLDLWDEGQMSEFAQFGSGITNYFKFLKWCCWIMSILCIIHIPILVINIFGNTMVNDGSILALTTLGNLGASDVDYIQIPGCDNTKYQFEQCTFHKNELALVYAFLDAVGTVIVIIGFYWLKMFEQSEVNHLNITTVTASDYTLRVSRVPVNATEREIAAHFARLTSSPIAEVNLAFKNADEIKMYVNRGSIMQQRNKCIQRIRYERRLGQKLKGGKSASLKRVRKLLRERKKLTSLLDIRDAQRTMKVNSKPDALQAFVTFDTEEGFVKAISAYQMNWIRSISCFYPKRLRLGGAKVKVDQAPEPSTIIWENIEVKERSRFGRKCLTTCIASMAILLSVYFTFVARDFKNETLKSMSGECPSFFNGLTPDEQYALVEQDVTMSHCFCAGLEAQDQLEEPLCRDFVKNQIRASSMSYGAGFMVCFMNMFFTMLMDRAGSFEKHQTIDDMESSNMTRLFILKFLNTGCLVLLYSLKFVQTMVGVNFGDPQNFNINWYETGGVGMIIVMIINIFTPHIGSLIAFYKYKSRIRKLESNLTKDMETDDKDNIWYTQEDLNKQYLGPPFQLNYRYTQLLVNFYICWMYAVSMPLLPMIGAISFFVSYWVDKFLFCNFYRIPPNYSDAIGSRSTMFIGYSILFHIFMSCWILGNNQIFAGVSLSNHKVDVVERLKFTDIILKRHIVILEIIAALFIANIVARKLTSAFGATIKKVLTCLLCGKGNKVKKLKALMNAVQVTYGGARARGVIKGLASYNILQNPKYQEAFAITSEFAQQNNRLSTIRGYNTKEKEDYDFDYDYDSDSCDSKETTDSV